MSGAPIVVIGAGAAGAMAAIHAARSGRRVLLLESTRDGGRKILISGGGRCNVLPSVADPARFVTDSPRHLLRHILAGWPLAAQRRFFEEDLAIPLVLEPESGKLFPRADRARVVRDGVIEAVRRAGAEIRFGTKVAGIEPPAPGGGWRILIEGGAPIDAGAVIVATGGLSVPTTGSDGAGLGWLAALGHRVHPTYPALTPLTGDDPGHHALAGVSLVTTITAPGARAPNRSTGGFLFTHRGWSGPAVLDLSHLATRSRAVGGQRPALLVAWSSTSADEWDRRLRSGGGPVQGVIGRVLPDRLAAMLLTEAGVEPSTPVAQLRREDRRRLVELLGAYPLPWSGDEGYRKAEVTGGGVALDEVAHQTLESRRHTGLYLVGELLDAFGPIGGHNFQWAWATGRIAGIAAGRQPSV